MFDQFFAVAWPLLWPVLWFVELCFATQLGWTKVRYWGFWEWGMFAFLFLPIKLVGPPDTMFYYACSIVVALLGSGLVAAVVEYPRKARLNRGIVD